MTLTLQSSTPSKIFILLQTLVPLALSFSFNISQNISQEVLPPGLSLIEYDSILMTEAPVDFDNNTNLFDAAMEFEWKRAKDREDEFSFLICHTKPGLSGFKRLSQIREELEIDDDVIEVVYNEYDKTCFFTYLEGWDVIMAYASLPDDMQEFFKAQPMSQSMKMSHLMVNETQKQIDTKSSVEFLASLCPGVVGETLDSVEVAESIIEYLKTSPQNVSSSSFFYQRVEVQKRVGDDITVLDLTEQIEFWVDAFESGLISGNCTNMFDNTVDIIDWNENTMKFGVQLSGMRATPEEEACIWSLVQGVALDPSVCQVHPELEYVPMRSRRNLR